MALSQTITCLIAAGLVVAGWIVVYVAAQRKLQRAIAALRREMEEEISVAVALVRTTQTPTPVTAAQPVAVETQPASAERQELTAEMLVVIAAAVTAFLGKKVRIRSAKVLETPYELINPWAQQGRVVIQASHNLIQRPHWD